MKPNQIQVGGPNDCPPITTTTTNNSEHDFSSPIECGWECPRCGHINAPWVRQCYCSPSNSSWDKITCDEWWQQTSETFKIHPESTIYTTNVNQVVGGSDYKDSWTGTWVNVPKTYTNQQLKYNNNKNKSEDE